MAYSLQGYTSRGDGVRKDGLKELKSLMGEGARISRRLKSLQGIEIVGKGMYNHV